MKYQTIFIIVIIVFFNILLLNILRLQNDIYNLGSNNNNKTKAKEIQISSIQLVSVMSGFMKILRVYTPAKNRKKVEIAAKSILGDLK